jgi:hypothetical protein
VALTKMFALRNEEQKPAARTKSYFFSGKPKAGGSAAGSGGGRPVDGMMQFSDEQVWRRPARPSPQPACFASRARTSPARVSPLAHSPLARPRTCAPHLVPLTQARARLQTTGGSQQVRMGSLERSDDAVAKQRAEMQKLLDKEAAVSASEGKRKLLGDASSRIESLQKALQTEEQRQDAELQRSLSALRQMM